MKTPMPSPNGTNYARLYLQGAAYDAATGLSRRPAFSASQRGAIRTAFARAGIAYDEAQFLQAINRENAREAKDEGRLASRIMAAIRASDDFDENEIATIEQALTNAGIDDDATASSMASDRAIHSQSFHDRFGTGRIKNADDYQTRRDSMFPHYNRLKS